ncbi:MAG: hypothetical protein ABIH20_02435 [Candidatus Diapherotrites archaeon]
MKRFLTALVLVLLLFGFVFSEDTSPPEEPAPDPEPPAPEPPLIDPDPEPIPEPEPVSEPDLEPPVEEPPIEEPLVEEPPVIEEEPVPVEVPPEEPSAEEEPLPEPEPEPVPEEVPDQNVVAEPLPEEEPPDTNVVIEPPEDSGSGGGIIDDLIELIPEIIFVSPIEFQVLSGLDVIIVSLQNFGEITSQWFEINGTQIDGTLSENTITAEINTAEFDNGVYDLEANACTEVACYSELISITIENELVEEQPSEDTNNTIGPSLVIIDDSSLFTVVPSNVSAALSVFDLNGNLVDSSTEQVQLDEGTYNANLTFLETQLNTITINELVIDSDVTLIEVDESISLDFAVPDANLQWVKIISLKPNVGFSTTDFDVTVPYDAGFVYECNYWDFESQNCSGSWELFGGTRNGNVISSKIFASGNAMGFAQKIPEEIIEEPPAEEPEELPQELPLLTIVASNTESNLSLFDSNASLAGSGKSVSVLSGTYDAEILFSDQTLGSISLSNVVLDSNTILIEVSEILDSNTLAKINPSYLSLVALKVNPQFSGSTAIFNLPKNFEHLFECSSWNFAGQECNGSWVDLNFTNEATFNYSPVAFAFSKKKIPDEVIDDYNDTIEDSDDLLNIRRTKEIKKNKKPLKDEPITDTFDFGSEGKRLYTDSECGETFYSQINDNDYAHRLENECLIVDFKENLGSTRIYSNNTSQILGVTPIAIEEITPANEVVDFVNFTENPFPADYKEKENVLNDVGFEKGRLSWSFNYGGADVHIYYKLKRSSLKWGLEVEDWNYSSQNNILRLKHATSGDFEASLFVPPEDDESNQKIIFLTDLSNNSVATISFADPTNNGSFYDSELSLDVNGNQTFIYQTLGNGSLIELDPSVSINEGTADVDGTVVRLVDGSPSSVNSADIEAGYDNSGSDYHSRAVLEFDITGIGSVSTAEFALAYQTTVTKELPGTFDLDSITTLGAAIDDTDFDSSIFEAVVGNWFDCDTIAGDINATVTTAWNNNVTAVRDYLTLRFFLDDTTRADRKQECEVNFYDTGELGATFDPYIYYTQPNLAPDITSTITNDGSVYHGTAITFTGNCTDAGDNFRLVVCRSGAASCDSTTSGADLICAGSNGTDTTPSCSYTTSWEDIGTNNSGDEATCCDDENECDATPITIADWVVDAGTLEPVITNPPADANTMYLGNNFLVDGSTTCRNADCGSVDTNVQYCIGASCSTWMDLNADSGSPLYLISGSQPQTFTDANASESLNVSWVLKGNVAQTYELRFNTTGTMADANTTVGTERTITLEPDGDLSFVISNPPADNNVTVNQNVNFLVNGTTSCSNYDCGSVDTNVQYCVGAGCSTWMDLNTDVGSPLYIVSGSQPQNQTLSSGGDYAVSWVLNAPQDWIFELRFWGDGTQTAITTSSGTDRTMTIQTFSEDFTFVLALPNSGCTEGEGSIDAGADCEKGYFVTTDLSGLADQTQVAAQGQVDAASPTGLAFFVYDNQSTASNDMNITLDLNAALPGTLELKGSNVYNGWEATCGGAPATGCVDITTLAPHAGTALYTTGTADLNIYLWADFVSATVGSIDRNVLSTGVAK